jgi:hypothetical protein
MSELSAQTISAEASLPARYEVFRPRRIEADPSKLSSEVGLFGTCGSPESTHRQDIFIPRLVKREVPYYNPQVAAGAWRPEMADEEADHMAKGAVIAFTISAETQGYASLAEGGWAILSALLRNQKLGMFTETNSDMSAEDLRIRNIFKSFVLDMHKDYPVFHLENDLEGLATWAAITAQDYLALNGSQISEKRVLDLPTNVDTQPIVGIFGTSNPNAQWKKDMKSNFSAQEIDFFDSYKENWDAERDISVETTHKLRDKVLLQIIDSETESYGSLAESGLLALSAFIRGQAYGLYIEDHPSEPTSDTNRARKLVRAHIQKLNEQFPGLVYLAESPEDLTQFAISFMAEKPSYKN